MTTGERIRAIRNDLGLTQTEFGDKIGLRQSSLGQIESGVRNVTDRIIKLVCSEFNASETWLRTGEGEMFVQLSRDEEISDFVGHVMTSEADTFKKRFISMLSRLNESEWEALEQMARKIAPASSEESEQNEIEKELEAYRLELEAERKGGMSDPSGASGA